MWNPFKNCTLKGSKFETLLNIHIQAGKVNNLMQLQQLAYTYTYLICNLGQINKTFLNGPHNFVAWLTSFISLTFR